MRLSLVFDENFTINFAWIPFVYLISAERKDKLTSLPLTEFSTAKLSMLNRTYVIIRESAIRLSIVPMLTTSIRSYRVDSLCLKIIFMHLRTSEKLTLLLLDI